MQKPTKPIPLFILLVLVLAALLAACAQEAGPAETTPDAQPVVSGAEGETGVETPNKSDPEWIQAAWQSSPHADTYVTGTDGKNSACTRCHAPANWIPTMDDMPESCYACKFEVKPPPPVVEQADWKNIECNICHQVKKDKVDPQIAWLEIAQIEQYAEVASPSELCLKCHSGVDVPGHHAVTVEGSHADMECTGCHNAHDTQASCGTSGCHETLDAAAQSIPGHDENHAQVACQACHDAGELEVGPHPETGAWTTFVTLADAEDLLPFVSHNIGLTAPCERCHFAGNPWGLSESVSP